MIAASLEEVLNVQPTCQLNVEKLQKKKGWIYGQRLRQRGGTCTNTRVLDEGSRQRMLVYGVAVLGARKREIITSSSEKQVRF